MTDRIHWFGDLQKVEDNDDGSITVHGIASSEKVDRVGEVVSADAVRKALPDFMIHGTGNLREMHQLSAVGTVDSADTGADGITRIVGTVVDPVAIQKVKKGVYKGFSIGGRVLKRAADDAKKILEIALNEISLVDRPAHPDAVLTLWKVDDMTADELEKRDYTDAQRKKMAKSGEAMPDGSYPIADKADLEDAVQAFGRAKDKPAAKAHITKRAKAMGMTDMLPEDWTASTKKADAATGEDDALIKGDEKAAEDENDLAKGVDASAEAAENTDAAEPADDVAEVAKADDTVDEPDALSKAQAAADRLDQALKGIVGGDAVAKGMYTVSGFADMLQSLSYMVQSTEAESDREGDESPVPASLRDWMTDGVKIFMAMAEEESSELIAWGNAQKAAAAKELTEAAVADALSKADADAESLNKALSDRDEQLTKLADRMGSMTDIVDGLQKRLATVEDTTLPPKTAGSLAKAVSKGEDAAGGANGDPADGISQDDITKAVAAMTEDQRATMLIKIAHSHPIPVGR